MAKAIWNNTVIAESDDFKVVEGNIYFPPDSVKREYFKDSDKTSVCPRKGLAHYYSSEVGGKKYDFACVPAGEAETCSINDSRVDPMLEDGETNLLTVASDELG